MSFLEENPGSKGCGDKTDEIMQDRNPANTNDASSEICSQLRALYDAPEDQQMPDRFFGLLQKLDEAEQNPVRLDGEG